MRHDSFQRVGLGGLALVLLMVGSQPSAMALVRDQRPPAPAQAHGAARPDMPDPRQPVGSQRPRAHTPAYAKGQFLVKFTPSLTQCAHCLFQKKQRFATALTDASDSLDRLTQQTGVTAIDPLYPQWHRERTSDATRAYQQGLDTVKRKI